jgi:hypothetical protein
MIRASCHTADNALSFEFDATPWFREADPQSILHIAERDWSSAWIAESLEARPGYERLHQLIDYAVHRLREESLEDPSWATFECVVDGSDAMAWLRQERPDVASIIESKRSAGQGKP